MAELNSIKVNGYGKITNSNNNVFNCEFDLYKNYIKSKIDVVFEKMERLKTVLDISEFYRLLEYLCKGIKYFSDDIFNKKESFLLHNDLYDGHIYHNGNIFTGFIDFGNAEVGNHLTDLAHYRYHNEADNDEDDNAYYFSLLRGYNEICPLNPIDLIKIEYLALFISIMRATECKDDPQITDIIKQLNRVEKY